MWGLALLPVAVLAWTCQLRVSGQTGIGVFQDDLYNKGKNAVLWQVMYSEAPGTTFFFPVPSDMYITIFVGTQWGYSESGKVLAAPGTSWIGAVDNGLITDFKSAGTCTSSKNCIEATVTTTSGFGNPVCVRLYKDNVLMSNFSLPLQGTAFFQINPDKLYLVGYQYETQAGVPVTDQMRANAYAVDLTSQCYDKQPLVVKILQIPTAPYQYFERPTLDPYGSRCGPSSGSNCVSVTFNGTWQPMLVAVFTKDRQWLQSKSEAYRPIAWQLLQTANAGVNYSFPYDNKLSVGALIFMTDPIDYSKYILASPMPAKLGQAFKATLDDSGLPVLALTGASTGAAGPVIQISTSTGWTPKYKNTQMVVMKNGVPMGSSGQMLSAQTWVFDLDQSNLFFKGDNQFNLYGKIQDFDIDRATGFGMNRANRFLGVYVTPVNEMAEFSAADQCQTAYCGHGKCNNVTGACDCDVGWRGMICTYPLTSCTGIDCGVHGYCTVGATSWICNCVDKWTGTLCELPPGETSSPTTAQPNAKPTPPTRIPSPTNPTLPPQPTAPTQPTSAPSVSPTFEPPCLIPQNPESKSPSTTAATVVVAGSIFFLVLPHWSLWLVWNQLQTLSLTQSVDNYPDRYRAYMSRLAILNFQGWGWLDEGDNRTSLELKPEYPCTPGCCFIGVGAVQNASDLNIPWKAVDQLPPTALHLLVALGAAAALGVLLILGVWIFAKCTTMGYEFKLKHSSLLPLLPFSLCFRVVSLGYLSINYAVYQHLVWFREASQVWTSVAWVILAVNVGLLAAYLLVPHKHHPSYEFAMASIYLDNRTNSQLRSLEKRTRRQRCALFWPFVGLFHNHLFGVIVATLQPDRTSVSFVNTVNHATDSASAMGILVTLAFSQIIIFVILRPYSSRFKTRITLFSQFCSLLCLCLLLLYSIQRGTTPETAPMTVLILNTVGSIISFILLGIQAVRELVGDDVLRARFPWAYRNTKTDPPLLSHGE